MTYTAAISIGKSADKVRLRVHGQCVAGKSRVVIVKNTQVSCRVRQSEAAMGGTRKRGPQPGVKSRGGGYERERYNPDKNKARVKIYLTARCTPPSLEN